MEIRVKGDPIYSCILDKLRQVASPLALSFVLEVNFTIPRIHINDLDIDRCKGSPSIHALH
jgi:hypothetical protein